MATGKDEVMQRIVLLLVVAAVLVSPLVRAAYEESIHEGIFLVRPENQYLPERTTPTYLASEDLTFFACVEYDDTPVRLSVLCDDNNNFVDVTATRWGPDNCFIGSVDLDDFPCYRATITADYIHNGENERLTKEIKINKITTALQTILDTQFEDGGWSSSLDTAFALYSLKPFADVFEDQIDRGLHYLKETRNEDEKCWPQDDCQISATALIAHLLSRAEYEDNLRIVHDATVYLEKSMSYIDSGETWKVGVIDFLANINNSVNTSCVFGYDETNTTFNLSRYPVQVNYSVTPAYDSIIRVVCTENVYVDLYSSTRGRIVHYEGDNMSYTIPGPCWTFNNENVTCDVRATAAAIAAPIDDDKKLAASQYLEDQLNTSVEGTYFPDGDIMNLALYLADADDSVLSSEAADSVIRYLLYRQTNEGAWNVSRMYYNRSFYEPQDVEYTNYSHVLEDNYTRSIVYTGFALQGLLTHDYDREDEPVEDAERWVSVHEADTTQVISDDDATDEDIVAAYEANVTDILQDPKRNAMALYVLQQNTRPLLKSSPQIVVLDKPNVTIDLVNPTTFALESVTYQLANDLAPYIDVEEKDYLAPYSFRRITISQVSNASTDVFGYLRILQGSDEYAKIPILIQNYPELTISIPARMTVFGTAAVAQLAVTKSSHTFACTLQWKDAGIETVSTFTIEKGGTFNLPLQFSRPATEEKSYSGIITCTARSSTFTFPFTIAVQRFLTKPIVVNPSLLTVNTTEEQLSFSVKNLLDESIDVTVSLRNESPYVDFSDYFLSLTPGEERNVTVFITAPVGQNLTISNSILVRAFNVEERIALEGDITTEAPSQRPVWLMVAIGVFVVGLLGILGYFGYTNRTKLYAWYVHRFKKESELEKMQKEVLEYERRGQMIAIKNMVQILKLEGVTDKDVRKRLLDEGFTEEEISAALKFKEEEPKKPAPQK